MNIRNNTFFLTALLILGANLNAYANPQGENVVSGSATFNRSTPNTLTVNTATNKTIINYNSFSIAPNENTTFNQPSASSAVLNRVVGVNPSDIYGTLSSNGELFLVNPNGILFGPNSKVNAPSILASTLDISNNDFLNGNYDFFKNGGSSSIINQGRLAASPGGYIALLSQAVNNQGAIIAPLGTVALAAGDKLTLGLDSQSQISVAVDDAVKSEVLGPDGQQIKSAIQNSGTIIANGGKTLLTAKVLNDVFDNAINNNGVIQAGSMQAQDGVVEFKASGAPVLNAGTIKGSQVNISDTNSQNGIYSTGSLITPNTLTLTSDGDISSLGVLDSSSLIERGNTFQVGGIFTPGNADLKNEDNAITYSSDTSVSGTITDASNIVVDAGVALTMTAETTFEAGGAFDMDPTSFIIGGGNNLSISALNASTLGNIANVNLLTLSLISGSTPVTFTSNSSSLFQVNTVKTNYLSSLSRSVGTGTSSDPIMIYSDSNASGGLQYISTSGLGLYYQLANNIDASETSSWNSGAGFTPIGTSGSHFTGSFNGDNYTISNLFIDLPSTNDVGLLGYISGATVENIGLLNANITGENYTGSLIGDIYSSSTISNDYDTGTVTGAMNVGGLAGFGNASSITDSYSMASVSGSGSYVGGLLGQNSTSSVSDSYATGPVTSTSYDVGGLVGGNESTATISNSYATGSVTGLSATGGLVGVNAYSSISNTYATGSVTGTNQVGGLVGLDYLYTSLSNSYATGSVTGSGSSIGGLVGDNEVSSSITNSYATGSVTGSGSDIGGLIGYDDGTNTLTNNWWYNSQSYGIGSNGTAQSTGHWQLASALSDFYGTGSGVGNLYSTWTFGSGGWDSFSSTYPHLYWEWATTITSLLQLQNINFDLSDSYTLGNDINANGTEGWNSGAGFTPIGTSGSPFTGSFNGGNYTISNLFIDRASTNDVGLFGVINGATVENIGLLNANITGENYTGSLIGDIYSSSTISNDYDTGTVTGAMNVGGLAGFGNASSITDSYSMASVSGSGSYVGGLLGQNSTSSVSDSYATGPVTSTSYDVGGLVGGNESTATISNSYATGSVTGLSATGGLVGVNAYSSISNTYATGSVTGTNQVGGLVGLDYLYTSLSNSYATGSVTGSGSSIGGLVGDNEVSSSITNSYATGSVTGSGSDIGGLIGYDDGTNTLTNNWWYNSQSYGIGSNGTAQSTGHWQLASALSDFYGTGSGVGNLYSTWTFGSGGWDSFSSTYPHLYWEWATTITSLLQLQNINFDLSDSYTLGNDINANGTEGWNSGAGFTPIGTSGSPFTGSFNGDNYTISNLFIDLPSTNDVGLLGYISGATVENIGLLNANITGKNYTGSLIGDIYTSATISNAYATGAVTGGINVGGLAGFANASSITDSYSMASVTGSGDYVGGLLGQNSTSSVSDSYATGPVTGSASFVGGLVGGNESTATISNSYATGSVTGLSATGGLVGVNAYSSISNTYATGSVTGTNQVGGLVGLDYLYTSLSNSYATGSVTGSGSSIGGLVGDNEVSSSITNSYATGSVTGSGSDIGGLIGYDDGTNTLTNNWWYNSLTYGIGSNGSATSTGNWQKASSDSDFYNSSFSVYTGATSWDFTSVWYSPASAYPLLR